jgi:hypothetical protein
LTDGKASKTVAARKAKESQEHPLMMNSLNITTMDEEQTQHNHQRGRRVSWMIWQRNWHFKYTQNKEVEVASVESNFTWEKACCGQQPKCTEEA